VENCCIECISQDVRECEGSANKRGYVLNNSEVGDRRHNRVVTNDFEWCGWVRVVWDLVHNSVGGLDSLEVGIVEWTINGIVDINGLSFVGSGVGGKSVVYERLVKANWEKWCGHGIKYFNI
jgi:hypothetical protein